MKKWTFREKIPKLSKREQVVLDRKTEAALKRMGIYTMQVKRKNRNRKP